MTRGVRAIVSLCAIACGTPQAPAVEAPPHAPALAPAPAVEERSCRFETEDEVRVQVWDERGRHLRTETVRGGARDVTSTRYALGFAEERVVTSSSERAEVLRFEVGRGTVVVRVRDRPDESRWLVRERWWHDEEGRVTRILTNGEEPIVTRCVRDGRGRLGAIFERGGDQETARLFAYDDQDRLVEIEERADGEVLVTSVRYEGDLAIVSEALGDDRTIVTTTHAGCTDAWLHECAPSFRIGVPDPDPSVDLADDQDLREAYARATGEILADEVVRDRDVMPGTVLLFTRGGGLEGAFVAGEYLSEAELPERALGLLGYAGAAPARRDELALRWLERARPRAYAVMTEAPAGWPAARGVVRAPTVAGGGETRAVVLWESRRDGYYHWQHTIEPSGAIRSRLLEHHDLR